MIRSNESDGRQSFPLRRPTTTTRAPSTTNVTVTTVSTSVSKSCPLLTKMLIAYPRLMVHCSMTLMATLLSLADGKYQKFSTYTTINSIYRYDNEDISKPTTTAGTSMAMATATTVRLPACRWWWGLVLAHGQQRWHQLDDAATARAPRRCSNGEGTGTQTMGSPTR